MTEDTWDEFKSKFAISFMFLPLTSYTTWLGPLASKLTREGSMGCGVAVSISAYKLCWAPG